MKDARVGDSECDYQEEMQVNATNVVQDILETHASNVYQMPGKQSKP